MYSLDVSLSIKIFNLEPIYAQEISPSLSFIYMYLNTVCSMSDAY